MSRPMLGSLPLARARLLVVAIALPLVSGGCASWRSVPLGAGGRPVSQVREGTAVDLRFAAPRRVPGAGLPERVVRVRGTVERARGDTLFVRVAEAASLGGEMRAVDRSPLSPVIVDRDVAVRLHERSGRRLALLFAGVAAVVAIVLIAG